MSEQSQPLSKKEKIAEIAYMAGSIVMLATVVAHAVNWAMAGIFFTAGSVVAAIGRGIGHKSSNSLTLRRLRTQQLFASIAYIVTGIFMLTNNGGNAWIACFTIATFLELYTAFRISHEEKKEKAARR